MVNFYAKKKPLFSLSTILDEETQIKRHLRISLLGVTQLFSANLPM